MEKDLRLSFNEDEKNYDRWRPGYPEELYSAVWEYSGVRYGDSALEIGIGTGQATVPFLKAGIHVTAVEYGEKLAAYCEKKFSTFSNFQIACSRFEDFPIRESFDLVYSATAFHWVDEKTGYQKAYELLREGGTIALFWNRPFVETPGSPLEKRIQGLYCKYRSKDFGKPQKESPYRQRNQLLIQAGFADVQTRLFFAERRFRAEDYIGLLRTYSDHRAMEPSVRKAFEKELVQAIRLEGGIVHVYDTVDLHLGRKKNQGEQESGFGQKNTAHLWAAGV